MISFQIKGQFHSRRRVINYLYDLVAELQTNNNTNRGTHYDKLEHGLFSLDGQDDKKCNECLGDGILKDDIVCASCSGIGFM